MNVGKTKEDNKIKGKIIEKGTGRLCEARTHSVTGVLLVHARMLGKFLHLPTACEKREMKCKIKAQYTLKEIRLP